MVPPRLLRGPGGQAVVGLDADAVHELEEDRVARAHDAVGVDRPGGRLGVVAEADLLGVGRLRPLTGLVAGRANASAPRARKTQSDHGAGGEDGLSCGPRRAIPSWLPAVASRCELTRAARLGRPAAVTAPALLLGAHEAAAAAMPPHSSAAMNGVCSQCRTRPPCGDAERELADHVRARGVVGIDEVVVVALEDVAIALDRDDAVQDDDVQRLAAVGDDVAHAVVGGGAHDARGRRCGSAATCWCRWS